MAAIATVAGEKATFCLEHGEPSSGSPFLYVAGNDWIASGRARLLLAMAEPVERAPGDGVAARAIIEAMRDAVDGCRPDDVLGALHTAFALASEWLLSENRANGNRRKVFLGLTCVVRCTDDVFIAQVPPGQALIRQGISLFAFPPLRSWSPSFQPSRTYDLPNPLGLREQTVPQVYYSRVEPGDVLTVVSSSIAARLEPLEEEFIDAGCVDDVVETLTDACDRHGIVSGTAGLFIT